MAGSRRLRIACGALGAVALVGHHQVAFPGDFDLGMVWILAASLAAGVVSCLRLDPMADDDGPGALERRSRTNRRLAGDAVAVASVQLVGAYVLVVAAVAGGDDDETLWFIPLVLALLAFGAWCLGLLAGLLVVRPLVELGRVLVRGARGEDIDGRRALLATLLLTVVGFAVTIAAAVDSEASGRRFVGASLPVLLVGAETETTRVASAPLLWTARGLLVALVVELVLLARTARRDRPT